MSRWLSKNAGVALLAVGLAQTAALAWMVLDRVRLLKGGREIVVPVVPVDPRSLFRGDFARLGYTIATAPAAGLPKDKLHRSRASLYVTIEEGADGSWKAVAAALQHPGRVAERQVVLKGRPEWTGGPSSAPTVTVRYGIERYYVPEGKGLELEKLVGQKKIAAILAVDARGNAAIKGLAVDGQRIYDEPLL